MKNYLLIILLNLSNFCFALNETQLLKRFAELETNAKANANIKPDKQIICINEQLKIAVQLQNDSLLFTAKLNKAKALGDMSIYDECLQILYQLLAENEHRKNQKHIGELQYYIGATYFAMGDYNKYLKANLAAKKAYINAKQFKDTALINSEIGLALVALGQHKKGIEFSKQNLAVLKKSNDDETIVLALDNLSNCYIEIDDYENSLKYQLEILNYDFSFRELYGKAAIYQHLAEINIYLKRFDEAQKYCTQASKFATELKSNYWLFDCYKNQSAIDEAKGNFKSALLNHQKYLACKDSVYKKDYDSKMSAMANLYELEHKQNEISNLEKDKQLAAAKIQELYLLITALILFIIAAILFINHRKNKMERILRQAFSKQLIETQESERHKISKELHDSVGQNILFIKNQIQKLFANTNPTLNQSVDDALEEVRNISKDLYPNQLDQYGLASAIEGLCEKVKESTTIFVSSDVQLYNEKLSKETKINCYRIVQECLNNTIKHASATAIRITGELVGNTLQLVVQDNGKGFEKSNLFLKANSSFGMLNLHERVRILNGKFELETSPGNGTKSMFLIPVGLP